METNKKLDNVLSKLRKLKAMYEGALKINSEGEAANAAAAIQRLLTQYNLSMEEIGSDEEKKADVIMEEQTSGYTYKSIGGEWELRLVYVICKWNFCKCFQLGTSYKKIIILGKQENLETVKWLRKLLSDRFVFFSKEKFKEYKRQNEPYRKVGSIDKYQRSYLMGCSAGLDAKLKEESDRDKVKDENYNAKVNALVVRNDSAINEFVSKKYGIGRTKTTRIKSTDAYNEGFIDGKNTELHKQVSSGAKAQASNVNLLG